MASKESKSTYRSSSAQPFDDEAPYEVEFTAEASTWLTQHIEKDPALPFQKAVCERRAKGAQQRRDLSLIGKDGKSLVTGEVKLPYQKDGATPYNATVVKDARRKAERSGAKYFFTWNVNECVLWQTESANTDPAAGQHYRSWRVTTISKASHLTLPSTQEAIKRWLGEFVIELAKIIRGKANVGFKAPDQRFVEALESALDLPIRLTQEELENRYTTGRGKDDLIRWMRDEQGWTIATDPEGIRESLERAAKFACYSVVNKLVFYEALMKRYGAQLPRLDIPDHIDTGEDGRLHLEGYFEQAMNVTLDYETVFREGRASVGTSIPFYANNAIPFWRSLVNQIHEFDFSRLDYEIIGGIFERLISPEERHKYGQFYTRVEVVDLINSFCILTGEESLLDPACGGGTFLVRAYARKRELQPSRPHERLLDELYGVDISPFACHLTTINLATRDLIQAENYPRIARKDFFDVQVKRNFLNLPIQIKAKGLGKIQQRAIQIPALDAVVGNPPYVRQEEIKSRKVKGKTPPTPGTKEYYKKLVKQEMGADLSGRSDLHCYFWPHATTFLKSDGLLCLLTSSQWLDVEYGFRLQRWILSRFKIVAIFESVHEPWFVGARVVTTITILQRCDDSTQRAENLVRFVQLRWPLADIFASDGTTAGALRAADGLRDEILGLTANVVNERYRARLIPQKKLLDDGIRLGKLMRGDAEGDNDEDALEDVPAARAEGDYYGGKWGLYVRAPDLWFALIDRYGHRFARLGELADVRFGVKSGRDVFFYPRDSSLDCLAELTEPIAFQHEYGVPRQRVESGEVKLVRCGEKYGEIRPIEAEYLEPEVHSLMEIKDYTIRATDCRRMILLVGTPKSRLKGTYVLKYIEWGESRGWHKGATCAARQNDDHAWYDLTMFDRPVLILPKIQQYRLVTIANPESLQLNCALLGIYGLAPQDAKLLGAILNSTLALLSRVLFARVLGNEGTIQLDVYAAKMMSVPRPPSQRMAACNRACVAFDKLLQRPVMQLLSERRMRRMAKSRVGRESELDGLSDLCELDMPDRRELDDSVLEMLGITGRRERDALIDDLYAYLREFFEHVRQKEERAIANKNRTKRKSGLSRTELAAQVLAEIKDKHGHLLRKYGDLVDLSNAFSTFDLPVIGTAELRDDILATQGSVRFMKGRKQLAIISTKAPEQAHLIALVANQGARGFVRIPLDGKECLQLQKTYERVLADRALCIQNLIAERTADSDLQDEIYQAVSDQIADLA